MAVREGSEPLGSIVKHLQLANSWFKTNSPISPQALRIFIKKINLYCINFVMQQKQLSGIFYAAFASLWWGVVGTIFFKFVSFATFIELTVHRTIWTAVLLILTTSFLKNGLNL